MEHIEGGPGVTLKYISTPHISVFGVFGVSWLSGVSGACGILWLSAIAVAC